MAENIYDNFIEKDDANIIKTVKFLIRLYSKNLELVKLKKFFKWRINSLIPVEESEPKNIIKSNKDNKKKMEHSDRSYEYKEYKQLDKEVKKSLEKEKPLKSSSKKLRENPDYYYNSYNSNNNKKAKEYINMDYKHKSEEPEEKMNIFNKLYIDSYKKQENKMLNDEIKRMSELEKCTFKPKV